MKTVPADRLEPVLPELVWAIKFSIKDIFEPGVYARLFYFLVKIEFGENLQSDDIRWKLLKLKLLEERICQVYKVFRKNGIEPILIKGWAVGLSYPRKFERVFSDIDLAVDPDKFEQAKKVLTENSLTIDLHNGLAKLDTLEWKLLFDRSILKTLDDTNIRILCAEDHLRILCVHWLIDGGVHREKLKDILYLLYGSEKFDWDKCLGGISEKRKKWILATVGLTHVYFGLPLENLPEEYKNFELPAWFLKTVEREWDNPLPLIPLHICLKEPTVLFKQIIKRIPPNPIQATIETDGDFDNSSRLKYQFVNLFNRILPSFKRIVRTLFTGQKY